MARTPHDHSYSPGTVPRRRWTLPLLALALLTAAAPARAGTYDVVSCGAPGANGVNRAWQVAGDFDDRFFDVAPACPQLSALSEPRAGVTAPNFTGAGYELNAPSGAILDRMVIWRTGYRFKSTDAAQGPWVVQGYKADASVIGGPLTGETCLIAPGQSFCRFGAVGAMAAGRAASATSRPRGCSTRPPASTGPGARRPTPTASRSRGSASRARS
jgi:hypothetical protein